MVIKSEEISGVERSAPGLSTVERTMACDPSELGQAVVGDLNVLRKETETPQEEDAPANKVEVKKPIIEPKAEEPKAEEPKAEEPKAEEPKAEEPKAEKPKAEELSLIHI